MRNTSSVILVGIALVIFSLTQCPHRFNKIKVGFTSDTITETIYDTTEKRIHSQGPIITDSFIIEVPAIIDTMAVLRDFYTRYVATDTLRDSNLVAVINDTVEQNRITGRSFTYQWLKPMVQNTIINNTTIVSMARARLYVGIDLSYIQTRPGISPKLLFTPKESKHAFSLGFDFLNKGWSGGYYFNIFKVDKP